MGMLTVVCKHCDFKVYDGFVIRANVVRILKDEQVEAKCKRCKPEHWVKVPLRLDLENFKETA